MATTGDLSSGLSREQQGDTSRVLGEPEALGSTSSDEGQDGDTDEGEDGDYMMETKKERTPMEIFDDIISSVEGGTDAAGIIGAHKGYLRKTTSNRNQPTFLHMIVKKCAKGNIYRMIPLIEELINEHPEALKAVDQYGNTPLMVAIQNGIYRLVKCICAAMPDDIAGDVLKIADLRGNNCLHEAIGARSRITRELIDRVSSRRDLLCAQNRHKLTPLHIAVEYERCNEGQLEVVQRLIALCDETLDVHTLSEDPGLRSVFRHHEHTHRLAKEQQMDDRREKTRTKQVTIEGGGSHSQAKAKDRGTAPAAAPASYPVHRTAAPEKQIPVPNQKIARGETQAASSNAKLLRDGAQYSNPPNLARTFSFSQRVQQNEASDAAKRAEEEQRRLRLVGPIPDQRTPVATCRVSSPKTSKTKPSRGKSSKKKVSDQAMEGHANRIRDYLKRHYMCTREDHDMIIGFLYEPKEVKQIFFSLAGGPVSVSMQRLEDLESILHFEDTLQYVELPNFKVANVFHEKAAKEPHGRQDHKIVLDWLKKEVNGVKRIVNLKVDDNNPPEPCHSDETIEGALKGIEVLKRWDWQRPDLSSELLKTTAKDVKEVVLYWSGSNTVLRSWGEKEGLNSLEKLENLTIIGVPGLESYDTAVKYLKRFKERLAKYRGRSIEKAERCDGGHVPPRITIKTQLRKAFKQSVSTEGTRRHTQDPRKEPHEWLRTMDRFAHFIRNNEWVDESEMTRRPIKIAVIDDGIDMSEKALEGKIIGGASFHPTQDSTNVHAPWWVTQGYHGTIMASLISRICPGAKLYVVRLDEKISEGNRNITAKSAEKAIRAAILNDVDIISMSWTIEETDNTDDVAKLIKTVQQAVEKKILLFCAAKDQLKGDKSHPGASTPSRFKIGAATQFGQTWEGVGESDVDFIFPGENVIYTDPRDVPLDKCNTMLLKGSSVATALAAGLAGLILYCVQLAAVVGTDNQVTKHDVELLKDYRHMKRAFHNIRHIPSSNKFLAVWRVFGSKEKVELMTPEAKEKRVMDVARELIREDPGVAT